MTILFLEIKVVLLQLYDCFINLCRYLRPYNVHNLFWYVLMLLTKFLNYFKLKSMKYFWLGVKNCYVLGKLKRKIIGPLIKQAAEQTLKILYSFSIR